MACGQGCVDPEIFAKADQFREWVNDRGGKTPILTPNVFPLPGRLTGTGYHYYRAERPTLLVALSTPLGIFRAFPGLPPTTGAGTPEQKCYRSRRGKLPLPFAGEWYLRYEHDTDVLQLKALDNIGGIATDECSTRGTMSKPVRSKVTVQAAAATDILATVDPDSEGAVMMNVGAYRVYFRLALAASDPAVVGEDFYLEPGGIANLTTDPLKWFGAVNGKASGGDSDVIAWRVY